MSDIAPASVVLSCQAEGCVNKIPNPCDHSVCRRHAPCTVRHDEGTYWSREDCEVCSTIWEKCLSSSRDVKKPAVTSLKAWVAGFQRNTKGPYLDSELSRLVLFPTARESAVFGFRTEPDDVSLEDEARLLGESFTAPSASLEASDHSEMEVEASASLAS